MEKQKPIVEMAASEENQDLGFGSVVARQSHLRLLNRDGSFNVHRQGSSFWSSLNPYHALLTIPWWQFHSLILTGYLAINFLFALAYWVCGEAALATSHGSSELPFFWQAFFFSVQTFATIGYGHVHPQGWAANLIVTVEALVGLFSFALATGLLFARFSRPTARILFSRKAVIAPYQGQTAFEFRIVNRQKNQIIDLQAKVLFSRFESDNGTLPRRFYDLPLERPRVAFFPLSWTVVHPIGPDSPLYGLSQRDLTASNAEFLILLTGFDETFSQTVHARSSYKAEELVWGAKFQDIFIYSNDKTPLSIDIGRLHDFEPAEMPKTSEWEKAESQ
jgi:inward rectifier potassium channel